MIPYSFFLIVSLDILSTAKVMQVVAMIDTVLLQFID